MNTKYFKYSLGFLLLALILIAFYFSKTGLFLISVFFIIIAMIEYRNMFKGKDIYTHKFFPELIGIVCAFIFIFSQDASFHQLITPILLLGTIFSFACTVIRNKKPYFTTSLSTIAAFLLIFCGLYIIKLTYYFEEQKSMFLILVYFCAVLSGDWIASIIGPRIKNRIPLAKEISPNKTVAGAISNLIASCCICTLLHFCMDMKLIYCIILGIIISVFSQIGDLTISTFKRDMGIKHSGELFCEYGGVLDRMDAFIFSAPAAYYFLFLITLIP